MSNTHLAVHLSKPHLQLFPSVKTTVVAVGDSQVWTFVAVWKCNRALLRNGINHPSPGYTKRLMGCFWWIKRKHKPSLRRRWWDEKLVLVGSWVEVCCRNPPLAQAFTGRLTERAHMFILEPLALTFRLIITRNQHLCFHYFSTFYWDVSFFLKFCIFFLKTYVSANKMPSWNYISSCLLMLFSIQIAFCRCCWWTWVATVRSTARPSAHSPQALQLSKDHIAAMRS